MTRLTVKQSSTGHWVKYEPRRMAPCGHGACPDYRCYYDGLCEYAWGDDNECRQPVDPEAWGNRFCTFHAQVEFARAVRDYREDVKGW